MSNCLLKEAQDMKNQLTTWRRSLHQMPELGTALPKTVAFVTEQLKKMEISFEVFEDISCVLATIGEGKHCFMLRSDMDGLPIHEETELSFASQNGCMHACGHDMHTSILLGAAKLLKNHEQELKGKIVLLFQSGEETFEGAKKVVERDILKKYNVDSAFGMHVSSIVPVGMFGYGEFPMASVYGFKITLTGHGGHGSNPETCIDPINAAVQVYLALQSLIARECPASAEAVLTIGQFMSGNAANVIPEQSVLQGTLRTFDTTVTKQMIQRINEITPAVAEAYRCKTNIEVLSEVPGVVCDKTLNSEIAACLSEMDPALQILPIYHVMGSEDFAFISQQIPSSYFAIGAAVPEEEKRIGQHNSKTLFNEDCLPVGAASYASVAMKWLETHLK